MLKVDNNHRDLKIQTKWNKTRLYWLLQFIGWFSLMGIEIFNFTFFINGDFQSSYLYSFGIFPIIGILTTHAYKTFFIPPATFSQGLPKIWSKALLDIVLISLVMVFIARLLSIRGSSSILNMELGQLLSSMGPQLLNIARYVMVWITIYYLYHILMRNTEILEETLVAQLNAQTTELELLKTQLNPSFLFQSLSSIQAMVLLDKDQARDSILKLSELLRYSLNYEKNTLVSLKEELNELHKYLDLEKIRLGDQLSFTIELGVEFMELRVPTGSLLNLMENAIRYGVETLEDGGEIRLSGEILERKVELRLTYDKNSAIKKMANSSLENLQLRLEKIYGEAASLVFQNNLQNQMNTILSIPNQSQP